MPDIQADKIKLVSRLVFEGAWTTGVAFLGSGNRLAAGNRNGDLYVWDLPEEPVPAEESKDDENALLLAPAAKLGGHDNGISRLVVTRDGKTLISAGLDRTLRFWSLDKPSEGMEEVVLDPVSREKEAKQARNDEALKRPGFEVPVITAEQVVTDHTDWVGALGLSRDESRLISGDDAGTTIVRNLSDRQAVARFPVGWPKNWISSAALSADGKTAFTAEYRSKRGDFDRPPAQARFWNVETGEPTIDVIAVQFPDAKVRDNSYNYSRVWGKFIARGLVGACFSPDGKLLAAGQAGETGTGQVHLIETETGKLARSISGHRYGVTDAAFSDDGRYVFSTGRDTTLRITQVEDGKEVAALGKPRGGQFKDWFYAVALSPDGQRVAATDISGRVHVWQLGG